MALVAKWAWAAAGGYYVRRDAMGWEDYDLWLRMVELGQFGIAGAGDPGRISRARGSMVNAITEQPGNKRPWWSSSRSAIPGSTSRPAPRRRAPDRMAEFGGTSSERTLAGVRCLVLGAGGFIGTNLCRTLIAGGAKVRGFGRSLQFPAQLAGVDWIRGSLGEYPDFAALVGESQVVFDLIGSGLPDSSNRNPASDVTRSILTTIELLEACRQTQVRRIVFVSSGGTVYGISQQTPIPESAPTEPISAYGIGKLAIEKYLGLYRHLYGLDYTVLRVANPYGPFQTAHRQQGVIAAFVQKALDGSALEIWGDGTVVRDFIHIDDVTRAMLTVLSYNGPHHVFNVGSGVGRSVNEILADIQAVLGRGVLRKIYRSGRQADVPVNVLDIGLIRRETGWAPQTDWLDGLRGTVGWLAAEPAA